MIQNPKSILIVEDERDAAFLLKSYLTRQGYKVQVACDLESAYSLFPEFNPEIILLDLNLPDGSGFEFLKYLNEDKATCRVIINSAFDDSEERERARKMGVNDFLSKPTDFQKISSVL